MHMHTPMISLRAHGRLHDWPCMERMTGAVGPHSPKHPQPQHLSLAMSCSLPSTPRWLSVLRIDSQKLDISSRE